MEYRELTEQTFMVLLATTNDENYIFQSVIRLFSKQIIGGAHILFIIRWNLAFLKVFMRNDCL